MRPLIFALAVLLCGPALAGEPLSAPFQVDGLVVARDDQGRTGDGMAMAPPLVAVSLGRGPESDNASDELPVQAPAEVTVIGSTGLARGTLYDLRRICEYLCGDSGEECHFEALYSLDRPIGEVGTPLAVLPREAGPLASAPVDWAELPDAAAALPSGGVNAAPLAWSPEDPQGPVLSLGPWDPAKEGLSATIQYPGSEAVPFDLTQCRARGTGELTALDCAGVSMILADGAPQLFSFPDYNIATAEPVARLEIDGTAAYLVRLGLKAQTVFGLLYRDGAGWKGLFRPRDYALIC